MTTCVLIAKACRLEGGIAEFRQNITRLGMAGEIVLSPPLGEQVYT
jgi:hypothetical protein